MYFEVLIGFGLLGSVISKEISHLSRPVRGAMGSIPPELEFHPQPNPSSTLIRYAKDRPSTYTKYTDALTSFLSGYSISDAMNNGPYLDCNVFREYRPREDWDIPCWVDTMQLGEECISQLGYGYQEGRPCVLFSLDRALRWLPQPYNSSDVPENIRYLWAEYYVTLKCEGADAASRENLGQVNYYPRHGFHFRYFPDMGQNNWVSPLVFAQFERPAPGTLLRVECKMYARNVNHNTVSDAGTVNFQLMVE